MTRVLVVRWSAERQNIASQWPSETIGDIAALEKKLAMSDEKVYAF
jgi:hypothetical protein